MNFVRLAWILLLWVFIFQSCGEKEEVIEPEVLRPNLVSSVPMNEATNVDVKTTIIDLNFDTDISVVSNDRMTINGESIISTSSIDHVLSIVIASLESNTLYTLVVKPYAIKAVQGGVNSDTIKICFTTGAKPSIIISPNLVTTNPSSEATKVYNFLKENYGTKAIASTMSNVAWNTNEAQWVKQHTGKFPAITTVDYIHLPYSPANWIDYSNTGFLEDWWANNGLVSAGWHWIVPTYEGSTSYTYEPSKTTFSAANATVTGTWENNVVNADLEKMANYLLILKNKNIPVIWRPLHEAAGNTYEYTGGKAWFWWGYQGSQAYKDLWVYMFNYFKNKGLNNLIWVWTTQTKDYAYYPGDDYVDIVGRDLYDYTNASNVKDQFNTIQNTYPNKIITLSEFGNAAKLSDQWNAGARWSYFMPWYDYDRTLNVNSVAFTSTEHIHANAAWWTDAFNQSYVITRDQMPSLK